MSTDWYPGTRDAQVNMAKIWTQTLGAKKTEWNIPVAEVTELGTAFSDAQAILAKAESAERTAVITAECQRLFGALEAKMRFIKDRYIKSPPLLAEDFVTLLLKVPDPSRTPRGTPRAQMTAEIRRSGVNMLILAYHYTQGTEALADPRTDLKRQVRFGLLPPPGVAPEGTDLTKVPVKPEELPEVFDTSRKIDYLTLPPGSSGKTAYIAIRLNNGKPDGYGPWCPIFHVIIP